MSCHKFGFGKILQILVIVLLNCLWYQRAFLEMIVRLAHDNDIVITLLLLLLFTRYYCIRREFSIIISACCRWIIYDLCLGSLKLASWNKTLSKMVPLLPYFVAPHRKTTNTIQMRSLLMYMDVRLRVCVSILNILSQSFSMTRKRG